MDIVCLIKQVPDTTEVRIDPKTGTLIREGVPSIINPDDKHALEASLRLKEQFGGKVTVLSMGPPQAEEALREAFAMGADECALLCDRAFAGADTLATSYTLATAVKKVGKYDIVVCGRQAIDGDTAQIGPQVAEFLGLPQITYTKNLEVEDKKVKAERALEDGYEVIETSLPCLITCIGDLNEPRYPSVSRILKACRDLEIEWWDAEKIEASKDMIGLDGSPTGVKRSFAPETKGKGKKLEGEPGEQVKKLIEHLEDDNIINR